MSADQRSFFRLTWERVIVGLVALVIAAHAFEKLITITFFISGKDPLIDAKIDILDLTFYGLSAGVLISIFFQISGLLIIIISQCLAYFLAERWGVDRAYYPTSFYDAVFLIGITAFVIYDLIKGWRRLIGRTGKPV